MIKFSLLCCTDVKKLTKTSYFKLVVGHTTKHMKQGRSCDIIQIIHGSECNEVENVAQVVDDESGESMKPTEEVPLKELGESELERLVRG